jgi:4,5-DOPA dioxygenase extradiol
MPTGLFVSHGVALLAADPDWPSTRALATALPQTLPSRPQAIVVVSAHWAGRPVAVTLDPGQLPVVDEGVPTRLLARQGPYRGDTAVAAEVLAALHAAHVPATGVTGRGLDHGALIPLRWLDPHGAVPVVQVSLDAGHDLELHAHVGRALSTLPDDVLVVASGGAVHNLSELIRLAPADTPAPGWAQAFDTAVAAAMRGHTEQRVTDLLDLAHGPAYPRAHPTPEHYLPLLVAAGLHGTAQLLHQSWQWSSLSMAAYAIT